MVHCSLVEKPADIKEIIPLYFDNELEDTGETDMEENIRLYYEDKALREGYFDDPK